MKENASEKKEIPNLAGPLIVKIGGNPLLAEPTIIEDIFVLHKRKIPMVIVHGGGRSIDEELEKRRIRIRKIRGIRVTDKDVLDVVVEVLTENNKWLVKKLLIEGIDAVGFTGKENLMSAFVFDRNLGSVGQVQKVDKSQLEEKLESGFVPVVSPIAFSLENAEELLNVNADLAAGSIASEFKGSQLLFLSDTSGVIDQDKRIIEELDIATYNHLWRTNIISGGMIPKIDSAFSALRNGSHPRIVNGMTPHPILKALNDPHLGTSFRK